MKDIIRKIEQKIENIFLEKIDNWSLFLGFSAIILLRVLEEKFLAYSPASGGEILVEYLHNFLFFANTFILIWLLIGFFLKENPLKLSGLIKWGFFLILLPPLIDIAKTGGQIFWSFYLLNSPSGLGGQFVTIFGNLPTGIVYFGSKIVFLSVVFLVAVVVGAKTKSIIKTGLSAFLTYAILFFMGSFPSWITFGWSFLQGKNIGEISGVQVAQFFGAPRSILGLGEGSLKYSFAFHLDMIFSVFLISLLVTLFWVSSREKCVAMLKNARFPQIIYHSGLFLLGLGLGFTSYPQVMQINLFTVLAVVNVWLGVILAWLASVIVNDIYDFKIDEISNNERPLQRHIFSFEEYANLGKVLFSLSLLSGLVVGVKFAVLLLIYQSLAWFYSAGAYRLKRFLGVATFFSAVASLTVVFMGFVFFAGEDNLMIFPWRVGFLLLLALTISLPIKDLKDIEGDRRDGVWTVPVIWGEELGRIIIASSVFMSFMASIFFLNEFKLFWWSLLVGSLAFLVITNKKIKPRQIFWWVLGLVFVYGLILMQVVFQPLNNFN